MFLHCFGKTALKIFINHVSISLKNIDFVEYCVIIFIKEYVKMLYIQSKFWKNNSNGRTAHGALDASITRRATGNFSGQGKFRKISTLR